MDAEKKVIEVTVRDRVATHVGDDFYVCGNTGYEIHFDFDEEWDALDVKTARFIGEGNVVYPDRIFSGNVCSFPDNPPISNTNNIRVGVFAGNLQTTTPARIPAAKSILCGTSTPAAPEDDAYHEAMEEMAKVATEARTKAAESAQSAAASAQSAVEAAASAQEAAKAAETAGQYSGNADAQAKAAQGHAEAAAQSETAAASSAEDAEKANQAASDNADDAEAAAKDAKTWAGRAEAYAGNAGTSADNAAASAKEAAASASSAATSAENAAASKAAASESAKASAQEAAAASQIVEEITGGMGGLYLVATYTENGVRYANRTYREISNAINQGKTCLLVTGGSVYTCVGYKAIPSTGANSFAFVGDTEYGDNGAAAMYAYVAQDGTVEVSGRFNKVPNPAALTITQDGKSTVYDGSKAASVTIDIPELPVTSVNGQTGDVTIDIPEVPVTSVNGQTGDVTIDIPEVPVTSVNGQTGDVTIDIPEDVFIIRGAMNADNRWMADCTPEDVQAAAEAGKPCILIYKEGAVYTYGGQRKYTSDMDAGPVFFSLSHNYGEEWPSKAYCPTAYMLSNGQVNVIEHMLYTPCPSALTFTGAVDGRYNGASAVTLEIPEAPVTSVNGQTGDVTIAIPSVPVKSVNGQTGDVTINIPEAVTDDHINELIDAKLGVIENGTY